MDIHRICRVCLEEGALTSIYSTDFAMVPCLMMMICAKIRVYKTDGLPAVICNNCIYRLGVAYHFKQECENSDMRLRQYLGISDRNGFCDAETNTELTIMPLNVRLSHNFVKQDSAEEYEENCSSGRKSKRRPRYNRKPPEEHKKRGPKPLPKLPHTCYECNKTFKCHTQLQMHARTHTGEKPFICRYCPRRFAQKYNLQIHERIHSGERPYQCEICSKQFTALGNFQAHQKIHTGVRDHICSVCQKAFYSAGDMSKHMVTHTGIKNNHCDVCGKTFSRQRDMKAHRRKLHAQLPVHIEVDEAEEPANAIDQLMARKDVVLSSKDNFKCPDCGKDFPSAGSLSVHFRSHGKNNLLNFQLMAQLPTPHVPPTHYHPHPLSPTPQSSSTIRHEGVHHISPNFASTSHPPALQTNSYSNSSSNRISSAMPHSLMKHMLPTPPLPNTILTHGPRPPPQLTLKAERDSSSAHIPTIAYFLTNFEQVPDSVKIT